MDTGRQLYQLFNGLIKEKMRMLGFEGAFQAMLFLNHQVILKSVLTYEVCMKASDVPKVLALTNRYTSQFEIGQVFKSEEFEELSH